MAFIIATSGEKQPDPHRGKTMQVRRMNKENTHQVWLVSFLDFDLGFFDRDEGRVEPAPNPFGPEKVSTMSSE